MAIGKPQSRGNGSQTQLQSRAMYLRGGLNNLADQIVIEDSLKANQERKERKAALEKNPYKRPHNAIFTNEQILFMRQLHEFMGWGKERIWSEYCRHVEKTVLERILNYTNYSKLIPKKNGKYTFEKPMSEQDILKEKIRTQVARAICVACEEDPDHKGDAEGCEFRWQDYLKPADAAIEAIITCYKEDQS